MRVYVASSNQNKIQEVKDVLSHHQVFGVHEILSSYQSPVENHHSFAGNSLIKAKALYYAWPVNPGDMILADDSGLEVEALGGAPGVHSARYASDHATDQDNIVKLLAELKGQESKARMTCVLTCLLPISYANNPKEPWIIKQITGVVEGYIAQENRHHQGSEAFGYDPVFVPQLSQNMTDELLIRALADHNTKNQLVDHSRVNLTQLIAGKTYGEWPPGFKQKMSHRALALYELLSAIKPLTGH
ncbi:MAG: non-canonical purine NTP pyrophosphatase [Proteobacteria bacterium]|nr:non-canonical purine NTP pyrophosphatase [Pseudomonadota bacterium]